MNIIKQQQLLLIPVSISINLLKAYPAKMYPFYENHTYNFLTRVQHLL